MSIKHFPKDAPKVKPGKSWYRRWLAGETPPIVLNWKHAGGKPPEAKRSSDQGRP